MEPIRTVTKYLPFIDAESQKIVNSIMEKAENYHDFGIRLCELVLSRECPIKLVALALRHAASLFLLDMIERITDKYSGSDIIESWAWWLQGQKGYEGAKDRREEAADRVIDAYPDDWLVLEMYLLKLPVPYDPNVPSKDVLRAADEAEAFLRNHEKFKYFATPIQFGRGFDHARLGNLDTALYYCRLAVELAKENDDSYFLASALDALSYTLVNIDITEAMETNLEAIRIIEALGARNRLVDTYWNMGHISILIGDHDQAVECFLEIKKLTEARGLTASHASKYLSVIYNNMGHGQKAVDYAKEALQIHERRGSVDIGVYFALAGGLILLGQFDDAADSIEEGHELMLKEEDTILYGSWYYLVQGVLEMKRGNLRSASKTLNRALRRSEERGRLRITVHSLFHLAEIEVKIFRQSNERQHLENAELYLSRLSQFADDQSLYNIKVVVAMLDADLQWADGQVEEAREILEKALKLCEPLSMKKMRAKVQSQMDSLDVPESDIPYLDNFSVLAQSIVAPVGNTRKIPFEILGCIVMVQEAGLEIYSKYVDTRLTSDPSLVAGLLSAVSTFTSELREGARGRLQSIVHQDIAVLLEHGEYATCALLTDKDTFGARTIQRRFLESFEKRFSEQLREFDGKVSEFRLADELFETFLESRSF